MAGLATSGTLTHWFRDSRRARARTGPGLRRRWPGKQRASPPGARRPGPAALFLGRADAHPRPACQGRALRPQPDTWPRRHLSRAARGHRLGTRACFETYGEAGALPRRLRAVGGGTRNAVWAQATSDASGYRQEVCRVTIGAAYGDAFLAALAVGDVSKRDIAGWNPVVRRIVPDRPDQGRLRPELFGLPVADAKDARRDGGTGRAAHLMAPAVMPWMM